MKMSALPQLVFAYQKYLMCLFFGLFVLGACKNSVDVGSEPNPAVPRAIGENLETNQNGWVSSGGDLFKTAKNPWFLKNVESIRYCIRYEAEAMSVDLDFVRSEVQKAFKYWKHEFAASNEGAKNAVGLTPLATQKIVEISCDDSEDLAFLFGAGSLTQAQKDFLRDPTALLGHAVRTHYDTVSMKGKGFIYIAGDQGESRYQGDHLFTQALWQERLILRAMLVHELGHVYGFGHDGDYIMSEGFAERLITLVGYSNFKDLEDLPSYLRLPTLAKSCLNDLAVFEWFEQEVDEGLFHPKLGLSAHWCIELELLENSDGRPHAELLNWRVRMVRNDQAEPNATDQPIELGQLTVDMGTPDKPNLSWPMDFESRMTGVIFLTPDQNVFGSEDLITLPVPDPNRPGEYTEHTLPILFSAQPMEYGWSGKLRLSSSKTTKSVHVHISPKGYKVIGNLSGKQKLLFNSTALAFF